jgi:hypothetical protein
VSWLKLALLRKSTKKPKQSMHPLAWISRECRRIAQSDAELSMRMISHGYCLAYQVSTCQLSPWRRWRRLFSSPL